MAKSKKIAIIGHFGGRQNILDGQTVKTQILYRELTEATTWRIQKVDTYYKSKNPFKLVWQTVKCLLTTRDIFVLLSGNGMRLYFPILNFFVRFFHTRIYHDVIGGNLDKYIEKYPAYRRYLNSFQVNWVETEKLKERLIGQGITNAEVLPNFKRLRIVKENLLPPQMEQPYRFCTFSRVMKEKGIEDAINAIQQINQKAGTTVCKLDIYGKVDEAYAGRFQKILGEATPAIRYCGMVSFDKSVEAISGYYALLFPTYWDGEGFAGTIVDAFSAGLPVIATDWNCNAEIIENGGNGILYPSEKIHSLEEAIIWTIQNSDAIVQMKEKCIACAERFQPDGYVQTIIGRVEA